MEMKEKQAFIFFVGKTQNKWERNREISNLYMNKVAIDEENQIEVFSVEEMKIDKPCLYPGKDHLLKLA